MSRPTYPSETSDGVWLPTGEILDWICDGDGPIAKIWEEHRAVCRRREHLIEEATRRFGPPPPDLLAVLDRVDSLRQLECMHVYVMMDAKGWHDLIAGLINGSHYELPAWVKLIRHQRTEEEETK